MKKALSRCLVLALGVVLVASAASARDAGKRYTDYRFESTSLVNSDNPAVLNGLAASAAQSTTFLATYTFDVGASCSNAGWTTVDVTAQYSNATYPAWWHVDDFSGLAGYAPLQGTKSLWCGARADGADLHLCGYATLPGYGNGWNQAWCTKNCLTITDGGDADADEDIGVAFKAKFDSEPGYDATTLEYEDCANPGTWTVLDGGINVWDGLLVTNVAAEYNVPGVTSAKVRLHFTSDGAWSDQDNNWPTDGAVIIDSLSAEGLAVEDFEGEASGSTSNSSNDWQACTPPGYDALAGHVGNYIALFPGISQAEEDPCADDFTCLWAAISGSTYFYTCGTPPFPAQKSVPYGGVAKVGDSQYLDDETWSPNIPIAGSGATVILEFTTYRDMPLDNLIFYVWHVRTVVAGCPGAWKDLNFVYYGGQKDWLRVFQSVGSLLDLSGGTHVNVALGVVDMCGFWCGLYGTGACHSGAPYLDRVKLFRIATTGPQWTTRSIDVFQDNFAQDGTLTGTVRADMAISKTPQASPTIFPGDSTTVQTLVDPVAGLGTDPTFGGKAVYIYVYVDPPQVAKSGSALTDTPSRFPYIGSEVIGGKTWYKIRFDQAYTSAGAPIADRYCIDLNDNLFTPGDVVYFFFEAVNGGGVSTYHAPEFITTSVKADAAANPREFTCLPDKGLEDSSNDIIYVDGMDGRGAQIFWDTAFQSIGLLDNVDRYDVNGPSSAVKNRLSSRVYNIATQITGVYRKILWDCGDLSITLGDGSGTPERSPDYAMVKTFLDGLTSGGGIYICGDDVSQALAGYSSAQATAFKSAYLSGWTNLKGNHRATAPAPQYPISPAGVRNPAGLFTDDCVIYGGCPLINDFDVMSAVSPAVSQMTYGAATDSPDNDAVISQTTTNPNSVNVSVVFSGFAFEYIRDDENDGVSDRAAHLQDIITFLENTPPEPTGAGPVLKNELSQNYPNPFNPQTTIAFSLKERGAVSVKVYNVAGQLVRTLANEDRAAGAHTVVWDGRNDSGEPVSSGVYFYKLVTNNFSQTKKMVLLK